MNCPTCGRPAPDGTAHCPSCGAPLAAPFSPQASGPQPAAVPWTAAPRSPFHSPLYLALLGGVFLIASLWFGAVPGGFVLLFAFLAYATRHRLWGMVTYVFGAIGLLVVLAGTPFVAVQCTALNDACRVNLLGAALVAVGVIGGVLTFLGGWRMMPHLVDAVPLGDVYGQTVNFTGPMFPPGPAVSPAPMTSATACRACGAAIQPGGVFCPLCGTRY